ncbi:MAG: hypothetical protein LBE36_05545 [Flavobacteriaceae bacterium]|nr:hypothetical protein [Flavobacteriaceae bacterium]
MPPCRKKKDFHYHPSRKTEGFADSIENNRKSNEAKPETKTNFCSRKQSAKSMRLSRKHCSRTNPFVWSLQKKKDLNRGGSESRMFITVGKWSAAYG